jgi:hypothetical protein
MAYFGNSPISASYLTDYFSGNNTTVAFTLSRAPVSASSVIITISGVKQAASTYGVSGTTLTFSAAPPSGTNNIEVLHLGVQPDTVVQPSYRTITEFTATAGQTTFSPASYTAGYIDVYRNGVKLGSADFTATNGTSVVLANACAAGDYVRFEGFLITTFNNAIANTNGAVGDSLIASVSASKLTGSRTLPNSVVPAGSVIQVVTATASSQISTTSTSYVDSTLLASITPSSASSKILVCVTICGIYIANTGNYLQAGIVRGATLIVDNFTGAGPGYNGSNGGTGGAGSVNYLDSPSTTSSTTYKVQYKSTTSSQAVYLMNGGGPISSITLLEIAA